MSTNQEIEAARAELREIFRIVFGSAPETEGGGWPGHKIAIETGWRVCCGTGKTLLWFEGSCAKIEAETARGLLTLRRGCLYPEYRTPEEIRAHYPHPKLLSAETDPRDWKSIHWGPVSKEDEGR